jgi:allantoicase
MGAPGVDGRRPVLARTGLEPDTRHLFHVRDAGAVGWLRLDAFPDGGLVRLRLIGDVDVRARRHAGLRFFSALPPAQALCILTELGLATRAATDIVGGRPLPAYEGERIEVLAPLLEGRSRG